MPNRAIDLRANGLVEDESPPSTLGSSGVQLYEVMEDKTSSKVPSSSRYPICTSQLQNISTASSMYSLFSMVCLGLLTEFWRGSSGQGTWFSKQQCWRWVRTYAHNGLSCHLSACTRA